MIGALVVIRRRFRPSISPIKPYTHWTQVKSGNDVRWDPSSAPFRTYMIPIIRRHLLPSTMSREIKTAQIAPTSRNMAPSIVRLSGGAYWVSIPRRSELSRAA
jgi:hypothetical protein